jgi:hypothetical protein
LEIVITHLDGFGQGSSVSQLLVAIALAAIVKLLFQTLLRADLRFSVVTVGMTEKS